MNLASPHLTSDQRHWRQHVSLRVLGLVFMGMGIAATSWLERLVHRLPLHNPRGDELAVALLVVFTFSFGTSLLVHGRGLFEPDTSLRHHALHSHPREGTSDD